MTISRTYYNHCGHLVVTFEVMNAPAVFMDVMNVVFTSYLDQFVVIFIDDTLVYSKTWENKYLRIVL